MVKGTITMTCPKCGEVLNKSELSDVKLGNCIICGSEVTETGFGIIPYENKTKDIEVCSKECLKKWVETKI